MKEPRQAQATLEYLLLAMLVMTGIYLMGPYALRSINAYFKTSSDQVKDSLSEEIYQSPLTPEVPVCNCGPWGPDPPTQCGNGTDCPEGTKIQTRTCTDSAGHAQCDEELLCVTAPECCYTSCNAGGNNCCRGLRGGVQCSNDTRIVEVTCSTLQPPNFICWTDQQALAAHYTGSCTISCSPLLATAHASWCLNTMTGFTESSAPATAFVPRGSCRNYKDITTVTQDHCVAQCDKGGYIPKLTPHAYFSGCYKPSLTCTMVTKNFGTANHAEALCPAGTTATGGGIYFYKGHDSSNLYSKPNNIGNGHLPTEWDCNNSEVNAFNKCHVMCCGIN